MSQAFHFGGVEFTLAAMLCVEEVGLSEAEVAADIRDLGADQETRGTLLARCMRGADADRKQGWVDYVDGIAAAAERQIERESGTRT